MDETNAPNSMIRSMTTPTYRSAVPSPNRRSRWWRRGLLVGWGLLGLAAPAAAQNARLDPPDSSEGYVARLLINEVPFPGESFWVSVEDSCAAQQAIVWVLRNRLRHIPPGYTQRQVAAVTTGDVIDLLTAGGVHGQVEGFYRDEAGRPTMTAHVVERLDHLLAIANRGAPGNFARIINHARELARDFVASVPGDRYAALRELEGIPVTGSAYGWMTDRDIYRPGGNFVRIGDRWRGGLGGNRFFTLRKLR